MRSKDEIEFQRRTFEIALSNSKEELKKFEQEKEKLITERGIDFYEITYMNLKRRKNFLQDKVNLFDWILGKSESLFLEI